MCNKKMKKLSLVLALSGLVSLVNVQVHAEQIPDGGEFDYRVRHVDFSEMQVYKVTGHFGYHTDIQFSEGEVVTDIAVGDKDAWSIGPVRNHVFIKPKADEAQTNLTVLTNKHAYYFVLNAHSSKSGSKPTDMVFAVKFEYPEKEMELAYQSQQKLDLAVKLDERPAQGSRDYWVKGSHALQPTEAWNDSRFTYLRFRSDQDIPAPFMTTDDGSESLVNSHMEGDVMVVHRVVRKLVLRLGNSVTCVFNNSLSQPNVTNENRTASPSVKRVMKSSPTGASQKLSQVDKPSEMKKKVSNMSKKTMAMDLNKKSKLETQGVNVVPDALKQLEKIRDEFAKRKDQLQQKSDRS